MKKLRIGVIGLGMGKAHINGYRQHPSADVVAVADANPERLDAAKKELNIPNVYTDALEMVAQEKLDIVSVVTPNKFHKDLTIAALKAGCHVLCEKPMAMNAADAQKMADVAAKTGKRLGINFSFRFRPQSFAMKKLADSGFLGEIYYARSVWMRRRGMPGFGGWFGDKELSGGGPLIDLGVHRLDLALWLMGYPEPAWIMGSTYDHIAAPLAKKEKKKFTVEDFACGFIKFKNGATLELDASWAGNIKEREHMTTRILGTKGGLYQYNLNEGYDFKVEAYQELDGCQYDMELHPPVPDCHDAYYTFVDAIVKDIPYVVSPNEGVIVMKILDSLYESARTGKPVAVK